MAGKNVAVKSASVPAVVTVEPEVIVVAEEVPELVADVVTEGTEGDEVGEEAQENNDGVDESEEEEIAAIEATPVPAGFAGTKIPVVKYGEMYARWLDPELSEMFEAKGVTPLSFLIEKTKGQAVITSMAKDGHAEELLYVCPENHDWIEAAFSKLPSLKAQFGEAVRARAASIIASEDYQTLLKQYYTARDEALKLRQDAWAKIVSGVKPYDAKAYLTENVEAVVPLAAGAVVSGSSMLVSAGTRTRNQDVRAKWSLPRYIRLKGPASADGSRFVLERAAGGWVVTTEAGNMVFEAPFRSPNEAQKPILAVERGITDPQKIEDISNNANDFWSAKEQEDAAAK